MKVLELLVCTISTRFITVITKANESGLLNAVIEVFFKFPWNNILHIAVQQILNSMIESEHEPILESVCVFIKYFFEMFFIHLFL